MSESRLPTSFSDVDVVNVDVNSTWKSRKVVQFDGGVQACLPETRPRDASTNTSALSDAAVQTEEDDYGLQTPEELRFDGWEPPAALVEFLRDYAPIIETQLRSNATSTALSELHFDIATEEDDEVGCLFERVVTFVQPEEVEAASTAAKATGKVLSHIYAGISLPCTAIAWNCTGNMIIAAYCAQYHPGWCDHKAGVVVWDAIRAARETKRTGGDATQTAPSDAAPTSYANGVLGSASSRVDVVLETSSCVSSVAAHPSAPSIIAAGTYTGEIYVWDTSKDDESLVAKSSMNDFYHREAVSSLAWVFEPQSRQHILMSSSCDGKILYWSLKNKLSFPIHGHMLYGKSAGVSIAADFADDEDSDDGSAAARRRKPAAKNNAGVLLGITSVAAPAAGTNLRQLLIGTEVGSLLRCATSISIDSVNAFYPTSASSSVSSSQLVRPGAIAGADTSMPWEKAAAIALERVPAGDRAIVSRAVERAAREYAAAPASTLASASGAREYGGVSAVLLSTMYQCRADARALFPNSRAFYYKPHDGKVCTVAASPFHRHVFATASADGYINIYSDLAKQPLLQICHGTTGKITPITSLAWSPFRPCVLVVATSSGNAYVYDLFVDTAKPVARLSEDGTYTTLQKSTAASTTPRGPASDSVGATVAFNPVQRRLLAVGDGNGRVRVWKLGWSLGSVKNAEIAALNMLATSAVEEEADDTAETRKSQSRGADGEPVNSISSFLAYVDAKLAHARDLL